MLHSSYSLYLHIKWCFMWHVCGVIPALDFSCFFLYFVSIALTSCSHVHREEAQRSVLLHYEGMYGETGRRGQRLPGSLLNNFNKLHKMCEKQWGCSWNELRCHLPVTTSEDTCVLWVLCMEITQTHEKQACHFWIHVCDRGIRFQSQ